MLKDDGSTCYCMLLDLAAKDHFFIKRDHLNLVSQFPSVTKATVQQEIKKKKKKAKRRGKGMSLGYSPQNTGLTHKIL